MAKEKRTFSGLVTEFEDFYYKSKENYNSAVARLDEVSNLNTYPERIVDVYHSAEKVVDTTNEKAQLIYGSFDNGVTDDLLNRTKSYFMEVFTGNYPVHSKEDFFGYCMPYYQNRVGMTEEMNKEVRKAALEKFLGENQHMDVAYQCIEDRRNELRKIANTYTLKIKSAVEPYLARNKGSQTRKHPSLVVGIVFLALAVLTFIIGLGATIGLSTASSIYEGGSSGPGGLLGVVPVLFFSGVFFIPGLILLITGIKKTRNRRNAFPENAHAAFDDAMLKYYPEYEKAALETAQMFHAQLVFGIYAFGLDFEDKYKEVYYEPVEKEILSKCDAIKQEYADTQGKFNEEYDADEEHIDRKYIDYLDKLEEPEHKEFFDLLKLQKSVDDMGNVYAQCKTLETNRKVLEEQMAQTQAAREAKINTEITNRRMLEENREANERMIRLQEDANEAQRRALERMEEDNRITNNITLANQAEVIRQNDKALAEQKRINKKISKALED